MSGCLHSDCYELIGAGATVRFCRSCSRWRIAFLAPLGDEWLIGDGLEDYRAGIERLAREYEGWTGAAFLYDLGGHAPEVAA